MRTRITGIIVGYAVSWVIAFSVITVCRLAGWPFWASTIAAMVAVIVVLAERKWSMLTCAYLRIRHGDRWSEPLVVDEDGRIHGAHVFPGETMTITYDRPPTLSEARLLHARIETCYGRTRKSWTRRDANR